MTDKLLDTVQEAEPGATLNYNKHYIGLKVEGSAMNFVTFYPRKAHVIMTFKLPQMQEVDEELSEADVDTMPYDKGWKQYRLRFSSQPVEAEKVVIRNLAKRAHETYGKPA
ncbi:MAG: hypothetical protein LAT83_23010 [Kiritimatiellae bacterium]|nr:hypothetical protein [Kiritimatiellia bacterium]